MTAATKRVPLFFLAHARSGDKGDASNVGVLAYDRQGFEILREWLTTERVATHFAGIVLGKIERFELPNLLGFNFLLHGSLGGGGSASLKNDAQGKTHGMAMLRMLVEVPADYAPRRVLPGGEL
jgi:hypothetical protein